MNSDLGAEQLDNSGQVRVWDLFMRVFHWSLVAGFVVAYFSAETLDEVHEWSGYAVLALVILRIVWGFIGSRHARFTDFVYPPAQVIAYVSDTWRGLHRRYMGHNPIGGVMALVLLTMLLVVGVSGVALYGIEDGGGPLAGMVAGWAAWERIVEDVHEVSADVLWVLIGFHVIGIVVHYWHHRENLVTAMWTGRKAAISGSGSEEHRSVR